MDEIQAVESTQPEVRSEGDSSLTEGATEGGFLDVKFNKQALTLSREDATRYAQKGMKYDTVEPLLATLKEVAAREGKTLAAYVEALASAPSSEEAEGGGRVQGETSGPHRADQPSCEARGTGEADALAARLAEDYLILRREVPEIGGFDTLPPEALREAAESGISLLDAYLRHEHRERCRIAAEQAAQTAAAAAAVGSQADAAVPEPSSVERAMLKGVWG